jgi:hypothetical protein
MPPSLKLKYLNDGDSVFVYSTERDGSISLDSVFEAFDSESAAIEHAESEHEKYLGFTYNEIEIYKLTVTHVRGHKIGDKT